MSSVVRQLIFGTLAATGAVATWYHNVKFMIATGGFSLSEFVSACYVNAASSSLTNDALIAAITFIFFSYFETRRLRMKNWWIYVVLTLSIAVAFAFPLFMIMRERAVARADQSNA